MNAQTFADLDIEIPSSCAEAKAISARHYFTGKPCPRGHVAPRFTSNNGCVECLRQSCQTYHTTHHERETSRMREYAKRDPEGNRRRTAAWFAKQTPEVQAEIRARQNSSHVSRRAGEVGHVTAAEWITIKAKHGNRCLRCGTPESDEPLTQDHVVPLSRGGLHSADNLQPLCKSCNAIKKASVIDYRQDAANAR